jgi:hypothetical protein
MSALEVRAGLELTRRGFLKTSGGLVIAFSLPWRAKATIAAADETGRHSGCFPPDGCMRGSRYIPTIG